MKVHGKRVLMTFVMLFLFAISFILNEKEINAEEIDGDLVVSIVFQDEAGNCYGTEVYASEYTKGSGEYHFDFSKSSLYFPVTSETTTYKVSVQTYNTEAIEIYETYCDETVTITEGQTTYFNFSIYSNLSLSWATYIRLTPYHHALSVDNLMTSVSTRGFNPSKNNYMIIRSNMHISLPSGDRADVRVRVLNSKGKYVYEYITEDIYGDGLYGIKWDGKASKNNEAGLKKGAYVKAGRYTVEVMLIYEGTFGVETSVKTASFRVNKKAPSGVKGLAKAKGIIMYTGDPEIDYMAEKMVKAAGVKSSMSDDQKVKRIYQYMTKNFKHDNGQKKTIKYKLSTAKVKKAVANQLSSTQAKYYNSKLAYSYNYVSISNRTEYCMQMRCGVCDDHAEIFVILCNHVGVEAGKCGGYYKNRNGSLASHAWSYAIVNGKTYYYDVDIEIQNYGKGQGNFYWYKKTLKQAKKNHIFY